MIYINVILQGLDMLLQWQILAAVRKTTVVFLMSTLLTSLYYKYVSIYPTTICNEGKFPT